MIRTLRNTLLLAVAFPLAAAAPAQQAGGGSIDQRVTRVEKELRAVQRKVFPNGETQFVEPEISAAAPAVQPGGVPASSPVADLTARVDALEKSLASLTAQSEQNGYAARQAQDAFDKYRAATDARIAAIEAAGQPAAASQPMAAPQTDAWPPTAAAQPARPASRPASRAPVPDTNTTEPAPFADASASGPVSTGDPVEDAYLAAYRLWDQKHYGEAETALKAFVARYPNHRRASYAQNLLGRAYLDDGQPATAAKALYQNYQDHPRGERAPDSLYYLGQALTALKPPKTAEACKVYAELNDVYGPTLKEPLKGRVAAAVKQAGCK